MQDPTMILAARETKEGEINLSIGEPTLIARAMRRRLTGRLVQGLYQSALGRQNTPYPPAAGLPELIELVRGKDELVVITNGARQALMAGIYALDKLSPPTPASAIVSVNRPYWVGHAAMARSLGRPFGTLQPGGGAVENTALDSRRSITINTSPNNPDGAMREDIADIWDAAYASPFYVPDGMVSPPHHLSTWSLGKLTGAAGLRVGWLKTRDPEIAALATQYIETTTSGVGLPAQRMAVTLIKHITAHPEITQEVREGLECNARLLEAAGIFFRAPGSPLVGMFAWVPDPEGALGARLTAARVLFVPGEAFGAPGHLRLNLGVLTSVLKEALERLR